MKNLEIIHNNEIYLIGLSFFGDPFSKSGWWSEDNEIGHLWARFMKAYPDLLATYPGQILESPLYEMHQMGKEYSNTGQYEVFTGLQIQQIPSGCIPYLIKILPEGWFAKLTLCGEEINSDYYTDLKTKITQDQYKIQEDYMIQCYDQRFKGMDKLSESEMDALIPLIKL